MIKNKNNDITKNIESPKKKVAKSDKNDYKGKKGIFKKNGFVMKEEEVLDFFPDSSI
jgi:hypothetical protein